MEIRNLGTSGLRVSLVGLGCNNFGAKLDDIEAEGIAEVDLAGRSFTIKKQFIDDLFISLR